MRGDDVSEEREVETALIRFCAAGGGSGSLFITAGESALFLPAPPAGGSPAKRSSDCGQKISRYARKTSSRDETKEVRK